MQGEEFSLFPLNTAESFPKPLSVLMPSVGLMGKFKATSKPAAAPLARQKPWGD